MKDAEIIEVCDKVEPYAFVAAILNYLVTSDPKYINDFADANTLDQTKLRSLVDFLAVSMELEDLLRLQYEA